MSDGALLDFDWIDPALPAGDGHLPVPEPIAARLLEAARSGLLPSGVLYPTRRGFRFCVLFQRPVRDAETYAQAVTELGHLILDALEEDEFPVARSGVSGFSLDDASAKVAQVQRLPMPGCDVLVTGASLYDAVTLARGETRPELSLEAALPSDIAMAARQIGAWVQIAPEVVVVHILATISALIGNTRYVTVRGLKHNVSLQFLTLDKSGAGKSTVRNYLERATEEMRREIKRRRKQAEREWERYELALQAWKSGQKSKKKRPDHPASRPEPPSLRLRETLMLTEATTEALFKALIDSPRGLLWSTSEAHEILGVLGRYSDGGKARDLDTARLRKLTEGEDIETHRAGDGIREIDRPFLAIDMDAQPGIRDNLFENVDKVTGFAARFLIQEPTSLLGLRNYVDPPHEPDSSLIKHIGDTYAALWQTTLKLDLEGRVEPEPIYLTAEAERLWAIELQQLERRLRSATADEEGFFGHLRGRLLRLAAVLALWENPIAGFVDDTAMRRAIVIGRYFLKHHRLTSRAAREAEIARAIEAIQPWATDRIRAGKAVTVREASRQWRKYRGPQGPAVAVSHFRAAGLIPEKPAKSGEPGRPKSDRWVFPNTSTKPAKPPPPPNTAGSVGTIPGPNGTVPGNWDARFAGLNEALSPTVELPPGGRGTCPFCQHAGCFGRVKDTLFWKCFSADHASASGGLPDSGDLLDLQFHQIAGRLPTRDERVQRLAAFENEGAP